MINTAFLILIPAVSIVFIVIYILRQWEKPARRVIHSRHVLDFKTENNEQIICIYICEKCGHEQHGVPPCDICDSDDMKPSK